MHKSSVLVADQPQRKCYYLANFLEHPEYHLGHFKDSKTHCRASVEKIPMEKVRVWHKQRGS